MSYLLKIIALHICILKINEKKEEVEEENRFKKYIQNIILFSTSKNIASDKYQIHIIA